VNVVLTGTATPYINATQQAARSTQVAARQIETSMRAATNSSSAALQNMARSAETQGARAAASMNRTAAVTESQMRRVGASGRASLNQVGTGAAQAASSMGAVNRAAGLTGSQLTQLGGRGAAGVNQLSASLGQLSSRMGAVNSSAAVTGAQLTRLGTGGAAAVNLVAGSSAQTAASMAAVSSAATAAASNAGRITSAWSAASAAIGGGMRFAAVTVGTSMVEVANSSTKALKATQAASLGLVAVFGLAAAAAARFEKSMSEVRAVTGGNASDMKKLSQAALDAGQATVYSATQAANAEAELARAGISTADIIGGALRGSLDLAASGQLDLGESAVIAAQAMNAFKLQGSDVGHIADVISAGAGKSATNVHAMGLAFRQAALLSSQTGLSLEQTVGTLSLFAQNALVGSDAGTSLKVMLQRLVPQSDEARGAMDAVGFSAYDASGNFIGLSALAANMKESFSKLTPEARNAAMATIFGSDAVRAATILYEAGSEGVDQWVSSVNDAGYATRVAATMTDNLAGDLERLKGAFETALISSGSSANSVLRDMAQALTSVVNWYGQLSPGVQSSVTVMAGLAGIIGLVGSSLLLMLPRIMAVRAELVALGVTANTAKVALLGLGRATVVLAFLAAVSYAMDKLENAMKPAPANVNKLTASLLELVNTGKSTGELSKRFGADLDEIGKAAKRITDAGALDSFSDKMYSITHLGMSDWGPLAEAKDKMKELDETLVNMVHNGAVDDAAQAFDALAAAAAKQGTSTEKFRSLVPGYTAALEETGVQSNLAAASQKKLGDSTAITADQLADTRTQAERLKDALGALNGVAISSAEREIAFRASLQELSDTVKETGHSLDVTTENGRKVKGSFLDAAQAAMAHAQAVTEQKNSVEAGNAVLEQDIAILKRQMLAAGFSTSAVNELINTYARVPTQVVTDIKAETAKAVADLQNVQGELNRTKGKSITIDALTAQAEANLKELGFKVVRLPDGHVTVYIPTGPPSAAVDAIQGRINSIQGRTVGVGVYLKATASDSDANGIPDLIQARKDGGYVGFAAGGHVRGYPTGGAVRGPGSGTSDSILARISNGEFVIRAASVRQYGVPFLNELNAGRLQSAGYTARPAARFVISGSGGQPVQEIHKHSTINLYGAKQSGAEQAAEIQRHLDFVG
jgi:TP901 family phage tail tape measure protein